MWHSVIFFFHISLYTCLCPLLWSLKKSQWIANSTHLIETSTSIQCLICGQNTLYNMHTTTKLVINVITLPVLLCFPRVKPNYFFLHRGLFNLSSTDGCMENSVFWDLQYLWNKKIDFFMLNNLSGSFNPLIFISLESI